MFTSPERSEAARANKTRPRKRNRRRAAKKNGHLASLKDTPTLDELPTNLDDFIQVESDSEGYQSRRPPPSPALRIIDVPPTPADIAFKAKQERIAAFARIFDEAIELEGSPVRRTSSTKVYRPESAKLELAAARQDIFKLQQQCAVQEDEISQLIDRLEEASSGYTLGSDVSEDAYFSKELRRLDHDVEGYVRRFLRKMHNHLPSRVPSLVKDAMDIDRERWRPHFKQGRNKKLLRAMAQRYISCVLLQRIFEPESLFLFDDDVSDAFSTIHGRLGQADTRSARWRALTFEYLLDLLPAPILSSKMDSRVETIAGDLWNDTRTLWVESKKDMQLHRLKRIVGRALRLSIEFRKLPYFVGFVFRSEDCAQISRCINRQPEFDYDATTDACQNLHTLRDRSRHEIFEAMTVFPGVYKTAGVTNDGFTEEDEIVEYYPVQLSTFDYSRGA
ncbi:hypothetical protein Dda_9145 [Drechslerella dactyloides]|uniref:Uncharacterized protein n=1 Tax=Drechslerella dactyloides TaxID=74499 RepID=A0AAD6IPK2_DREDA|nr:hypothetical protein Dda_9145 [Drechslerella dactyloides]